MYWQKQLGDRELLIDGRFIYQEPDGFIMAFTTVKDSDVIKLAVVVPNEDSYINLKLKHLDALERLIKEVRNLKAV